MKKNSIFLRDPEQNLPIEIIDDEIISKSGKKYKIVDGIPRFVERSNYSDNFGLQWKKFSKTQLDSYSGLKISEERLIRCLGVDPSKLKNKFILEAGSGAGRFTEILIKYEANVHSFDYSTAVEANAINNNDENLIIVQADIRKIPFKKKFYDFVVCLGVLQHTPNPKESIQSLWNMLKPGGKLILDHYLFKWRVFLPPPFGQALGIYRRLILFIPKKWRYNTVKKLVDFWFPFHWKYRDNYFITRILRRLSPVIFHYENIKLKDRDMYYQWSLLDTHDSTTDDYKHLKTKKEIENYLKDLGALDITIREAGNGIEASCVKPIN